MKLICLNVWGGKVFQPLMDFIKKTAATADIFCFQEVFDSPVKKILPGSGSRSNFYNQIREAIPEFKGFFSASENGYDIDVDCSPVENNINLGLALFFKPPIEVNATESFFVHETKNKNVKNKYERPRLLQRANLTLPNGESLNLFNFHGLLDGGGKFDTSQRDAQFASIQKIISGYEGKKILCGDFNIRPDTKNIALMEKNMTNLIKEHNILKTRNRFYEGMGKYNDLISDYIFVSKDINVKDFRVLDIEISDHLPLILEFE